MKYELKTLKDVFDKVPADRISDCLKELGIAMLQARAMLNVMNCVAEGNAPVFEWPDFVEWNDDDKHEIGLSFYSTKNEKEVLRIEAKLCEDDG